MYKFKEHQGQVHVSTWNREKKNERARINMAQCKENFLEINQLVSDRAVKKVKVISLIKKIESLKTENSLFI